MAREFHEALQKQGCESYWKQVPGRNHNSIMFRAIDPDDPVAHAIVEFIRVHALMPASPAATP